MNSARDSVLIREGRHSIIKSNQTTTFYFGDDSDEEENTNLDIVPEETFSDNRSKWEELQSKIAKIHEVQEKKEEEKQNQLNEESKDQVRTQINKLLNKSSAFNRKL